VVDYRCFGREVLSHSQGSCSLIIRRKLYVVPKRRQPCTNIHCIISQKYVNPGGSQECRLLRRILVKLFLNSDFAALNSPTPSYSAKTFSELWFCSPELAYSVVFWQNFFWALILQPWTDMARRSAPCHVDGRVRSSERQFWLAKKRCRFVDQHEVRLRTDECPRSGNYSQQLDNCATQKHLHSTSTTSVSCLLSSLSFRPFVRPSSKNNSAPHGRIFIEFHIRVYLKICWQNTKFIKIWQE
jgi:hypothetical protein